jgi:hypothetical protein
MLSPVLRQALPVGHKPSPALCNSNTMLGLFKQKEKKSPEQVFWSWFIDNKRKIEQFVDSDHKDYSVYNKLTSKIQEYNKNLFPELTKSSSDEFVLIITPDGMKDGVEPTKSLAAVAPKIENWIVTKFRQPTDKILLNFKGLEYPSSDIEILHEIDSKREVVNINVFVRNMNKDPALYQSLAFLYLDHILGEFNSIMKVGYIDFHHLDQDKKVENSISLLDLRSLIARELY